MDELGQAEGAARTGVRPGAERQPGTRLPGRVLPPRGVEPGEAVRLAGHELGQPTEEQGTDQHHPSGRDLRAVEVHRPRS